MVHSVYAKIVSAPTGVTDYGEPLRSDTGLNHACVVIWVDPELFAVLDLRSVCSDALQQSAVSDQNFKNRLCQLNMRKTKRAHWAVLFIHD